MALRNLDPNRVWETWLPAPVGYRPLRLPSAAEIHRTEIPLEKGTVGTPLDPHV